MGMGPASQGTERQVTLKAYCVSGTFLASGKFCLTSAAFGGSDDELPVLEPRAAFGFFGLGLGLQGHHHKMCQGEVLPIQARASERRRTSRQVAQRRNRWPQGAPCVSRLSPLDKCFCLRREFCVALFSTLPFPLFPLVPSRCSRFVRRWWLSAAAPGRPWPHFWRIKGQLPI